jgi:protein involved in polysaccharide export with SLBB domain
MSGRAEPAPRADRGLSAAAAGRLTGRTDDARHRPFRNRRLATLLLLSACAGAAPLQEGISPSRAGVRPGDIIAVTIPNEPTYTGQYTVDSRGRVTLPSVGVVFVMGRMPDQVSDSLVTLLRRFVNNPAIQVTVLKRILVAGEVAKPGLYPVDATVTVGDLIATAGGPNANASRNKIQLIRNGRVLVSSLGPGTPVQNTPLESGDQIFIPQQGWFARNGRYFIIIGTSVTSAVLTAILLRR